MSIDVTWSMVRKATTNMFEDRDNTDDNISDMGWEIYPEGIYQMIKSVSKYNKPIYITAFVPTKFKEEPVAKFILTLSLKAY